MISFSSSQSGKSSSSSRNICCRPSRYASCFCSSLYSSRAEVERLSRVTGTKSETEHGSLVVAAEKYLLDQVHVVELNGDLARQKAQIRAVFSGEARQDVGE